MKQATLSLLWLLSCGCASSPPVRFFVLDPVAPATPERIPTDHPVQLSGVRVPALLDRRELVREEAPHRLTIDPLERWGAPLADLTERVLSQDLLLRLAPGEFVLADQPPPAGSRTISVQILEFGVDASGKVVLEGSWAIVASGSEAAMESHHFLLSEPGVAKDAAGQARLMSALLGELADSMVRTL
ncbi:MAG TPA: PqiC family protein [Steroidobacteraceae bacterium]|nr:PqiC family protein [Steroidobacteraceae bacterium]